MRAKQRRPQRVIQRMPTGQGLTSITILLAGIAVAAALEAILVAANWYGISG